MFTKFHNKKLLLHINFQPIDFLFSSEFSPFSWFIKSIVNLRVCVFQGVQTSLLVKICSQKSVVTIFAQNESVHKCTKLWKKSVFYRWPILTNNLLPCCDTRKNLSQNKTDRFFRSLISPITEPE